MGIKMDIHGLEGDISNFDEIRSATRQLFELQMKEGHRYYRDGTSHEKRKEGFSLSSNELVFECLGIVLQNAVFLLCQCIGNQSSLVDGLSKNVSLELLPEKKESLERLVMTMQSINNSLRDFEVEKIRIQRELGGMTSEIAAQMLSQYVVEDEDVIFVLNSIPPKYLIKWIVHSVNVNILPFKHEMYKLVGGSV